MGSGKSKLGKKVAKQLNLSFFDLDHEIEVEEGLTILQLFQDRGEAMFRQLEAQKLASLIINNESFVLSTGGGTPCFLENMSLMNQSGTTIYLNVSSDILFGRLKTGKANRPLIANLSDEELRLFIDTSINKRANFYNQASIIADEANMTAKKIIDLI